MKVKRKITDYLVVMNGEEQYSIWHTGKQVPLGWSAVDIPEQWLAQYQCTHKESEFSDKKMCLAYIESVWTDMRPLSFRIAMQNSMNQLNGRKG